MYIYIVCIYIYISIHRVCMYIYIYIHIDRYEYRYRYPLSAFPLVPFGFFYKMYVYPPRNIAYESYEVCQPG